MQDYSADERERAIKQVADHGALKGYPSSWPVALDLQMELNRAVGLLRKIAVLMPEKDIVMILAPDSGLGIRR